MCCYLGCILSQEADTARPGALLRAGSDKRGIYP